MPRPVLSTYDLRMSRVSVPSPRYLQPRRGTDVKQIITQTCRTKLSCILYWRIQKVIKLYLLVPPEADPEIKVQMEVI